MPAQILLADDHQIVRQGVKALLEENGFKVAGEASDGQEALRLAKELHPDVAVLDLAMPLVNGIEATRRMLQDTPGIKVIILTIHTEDAYILEAFQAGAAGYVVKTEAASSLVKAINQILQGSTYLSINLSHALVQSYLERAHSSADQLTSRERQVLELIAEGKTTKEIAGLLGISFKTAESHRTKIMNKLGIHGTAVLVRYAIRRGLVRP